MTKIAKEASSILQDIIYNENIPSYWKNKFDNLSHREDYILRGCFKELSDAHYISAKWADNYPYILQVLKDGYLYEEHMKEEEKMVMTQFERELSELLERTKYIKKPINAAAIGTDIAEYNRESEVWINDVEIFYNRYLKEHALANRIYSLLFQRSRDCYTQLVSCLNSVSNDKEFIDKVNGIEKKMVPAYQARTLPKYDVFLSHANADK